MAAKKKAAKSARAGSQNKTAFVLSLPREMPARDAVAKAKAAGIQMNEAYVYKIRSTSKTGSSAGKASGPVAKRGPGRPPKAASSSAPSASAPAGKSSGAPSKTEFVRSLPSDMSYADAAAKAKALGIELSKAYFYVLKSELKKSGKSGASSVPGAAPVAKGKPGRKPRAQVTSTAHGLRLTSGNPNEQAVIDAVRALGANRARELIAVVEKFERG